MNKFEKLIEYIINDEDQKARDLFHDIVVEKSRDIYESIMDEESMEETVHGQNDVEEMVDELTHEESVGEEDEEGSEMELDHDADADAEVGDELAMHADSEEEEHEEIEDKVMDIDAKLDELLSKFDEIMGHNEAPAMGDEEGEEEEEESAHMFEADEEEEEEEEEESKEPKAKKTEESKSRKLSTSEMMREYVDRIGDIYGGEGDAAEGTAVGAAGKKVSVNAKPGSVGPGADFGGTASNIVSGKGDNESPDGKSIPKPSNEYSKGEGKLIGNVGNTPGGDKKLKAEPAGHGAEKNGDTETGKKVGSTSEKASINKKSEIGGKVR